MVKIAIDAGHGMRTPGKMTPDGMHEFEFNSKVADYLKIGLSEYEDIEILYVHDPDGSSDVPLNTRTNNANKWKADLYLSLHANAFGSGSWNDAHGIETFIHPDTPQKTKDIATVIHKNITSATKLKNRGLKRSNFHVLRETDMSAVLVEHAFMTNKNEAALLKSDSFRKLCAQAHVKSLVSYFNLKKKIIKQTIHQTNKLYRVQVGAFKIKGNAEKLVEELKSKGYDSFIV